MAVNGTPPMVTEALLNGVMRTGSSAKNSKSWLIMTPQSVGLAGSRLSVGKLSGRRGLQGKLHELGHEIEGDALDRVYRQAIALADAKKEVTDADLVALVEAEVTGAAADEASMADSPVRLEGWSVSSSKDARSSAARTRSSTTSSLRPA